MPNVLRVVLYATLVLSCSQPAHKAGGEQAQGPQPDPEPRIRLSDVTQAAGIAFEHVDGATGQLHMPEVMGAGAALFDADADGDLDLYLVQGNTAALASSDAPAHDPKTAARDRLLRNELIPSGHLRFTDVTETSGLEARGYGMGVTTGDVDNDGDVDLFLTNFGGPDELWLNHSVEPGETQPGALRFERVEDDRSGLGDPRWTTGASFADLDRDGWLDLVVTGYVAFDPTTTKTCYHPSSAEDYCGPQSYRALPDRLYRNRGGSEAGTFEDVTTQSGLGTTFGPGLGVVTADVDGDGWLDVLVANDAADNQLWRNQGGLRFVDDGLLAGVATNGSGQREASMGIAVFDLETDGDLDFFLTHLDTETNTLYVNQGDGTFLDRTRVAGLAADSWPFTAFGTGRLDADGDGIQDLLVLNGAVKRFNEHASASESPLAQPAQLYRGLGDGRFVLASATPAISSPAVRRGAAFGDIDNDGDIDVILTENGGPARLVRNDAPTRPWLGLRLIEHGRDALGTRIQIEQQGETSWQWVHTDGSYLSARDPRILVTGSTTGAPIQVEVTWSDGATERFDASLEERYRSLVQGTGGT